MGTRRYRGAVSTLEQAMFADMLVRITCDRCGYFQQMHAYELMRKLSKRRKEVGVKLWQPAPGFYCRGCKRKVKAIISAPMQWA
jgi:hypothetical protein